MIKIEKKTPGSEQFSPVSGLSLLSLFRLRFQSGLLGFQE